MLKFLILVLFAWANAESQINRNCDLIKVSHIAIHENDNGTLNIDFAWERKLESYDAIGAPVKLYVVRHGPMDGGKILSNSSEILKFDADKDWVTLQNVIPSKNYGIQICAVSTSYRFLFQDDVWDRAPVGGMGLIGYDKKVYATVECGDRCVGVTKPPNSDDYGTTPDPDDIGMTPDPDDFGTTPNPDIDTAPSTKFNPRCDLVQTSSVDTSEDEETNTLTVDLSWSPKTVSYDKFGSFEEYVIRYGRQESWGSPIMESDAHYMILTNETNSFELTGIPRGGFYGVQICAVDNANDFMSDFDWQNKSWLGSMGFTEFAPIAEPMTTTGTPLYNQDGAYSVTPNQVFYTMIVPGSSNYSILLLVLTVISLTTTVVACIWVAMLRRRRSANKIAELP